MSEVRQIRRRGAAHLRTDRLIVDLRAGRDH